MSNTGWVIRKSAPASRFFRRRSISLSISWAIGLNAAPIAKLVRLPISLARVVHAVIERADDAGEAVGGYIEHRGRGRVIPHAGRVAGQRQNAVDSQGVGAQQRRVHPQQVQVAAGEMEYGGDPEFLARRGARTQPRSCARGPWGCR